MTSAGSCRTGLGPGASGSRESSSRNVSVGSSIGVSSWGGRGARGSLDEQDSLVLVLVLVLGAASAGGRRLGRRGGRRRRGRRRRGPVVAQVHLHVDDDQALGLTGAGLDGAG